MSSTRRHRLPPLTSLVTACLATSALAQSDPPTFSAGTSSVVLDVVVRDRRGGMARGLQASDFDVFEDGVRQTIESFQFVTGPEGPAPPRRPAPGSSVDFVAEAAAREGAVAGFTPTLAALVFDRLSPAARAFAHRSALHYATNVHRAGDVLGVFVIGLALRTVEPFTDDPRRIRSGIERAASQGWNAVAARESLADVRQRSELSSMRENRMLGLVKAGAGNGPAIGDLKNQAAMEHKLVALEQAALTLEQEQQGHAATRGLLAIVRALGGVSGRKTMILFSEGLAAPTATASELRSVVDAANQAKVSIYAVDAGGLHADSTVAAAREELTRSVELRARQLLSGGDDTPHGNLTRQLERNEELLRRSPASSLGPLARDTGGFLISDTNDVSERFRQLADEMHCHYIVAYSPRNEAYDDRFRKLRVRVRRPGLEVRTRRGYVATRPLALSR